MIDSRTKEVNALVDAADMAVRTACVLDLLANSRPLPPFADKAVERAIAMLDDALGGSALLTGQDDIQGFSGNLDALCWATDTYPADQANDPSGVEKSLKKVQQQMVEVRDRIRAASKHKMAPSAIPFDDAKHFFDSLAKLLARRATASLRG